MQRTVTALIGVVALVLGIATPALAAPVKTGAPSSLAPPAVPTATVTATQIDPTTGIVISRSVTTIPETEVPAATPGGKPTWTFSGAGAPVFAVGEVSTASTYH